MPLLADSIRSLASALTVAAIVIAGLVIGRDVLIPLAIATILTFMLQPLTRWLSNRRVPHVFAVGGVFATLIAVVAGLSVLFSSQLLQLTADLSSYRQNMVEKARILNGVSSGEGVLRRAVDSVDRLAKEIGDELSKPTTVTTSEQVVVTKPQSGGLIAHVSSLLAPAAQVFLALLFTLFLLMQHQDLRDRVVRVAGTDNLRDTTAAMSDAGERLSQLFIAQAILNAGFGIFVSVVLFLIGVPHPLLWGFTTAVMRFVPFVGSFIAAVPPIVLAACVDPGWGMAIATLLLFAIGEPIMGHVIEPIWLGSKAGLSPFAMIAAASFWTLIWGPVGLLLAAPITMVVVILGRYIGGLEFFSILLGDEPALAPQQELYHRILIGDSVAAADQIEEGMRESTPGEVSDSVVLPALRLAAVDHRRAKLDRDQAHDLHTTLTEVTDLVANVAGAEGEDRSDTPSVLVVPAQGPIDSAAAGYVARIVEATTKCPARAVSHTTGLTALSDVGASGLRKTPATIIVMTVGGIEQQHLRFIVRRAARDFPQSRVMILDAGSHRRVPSRRDPELPPLPDVLRSTSLAEIMSQIACVPPETPLTNQQLAAVR